MKKLFLALVLIAITTIQLNAQKDANIRIMNLQCWWDSYDAKTMTIKNVNVMVGADGDNSKDKTGPLKVKLYLYNKEYYDANKEVFYVKTWSIESLWHMGTHEWKNQNIKISGFGIPPGTWRLGVYADADNEIKEANENDNTGLMEGEIIIKEGQTEPQTTTTNPNTTDPNNTNTNTNTTTQEKPVDPDQALKDEKAKLELELTDFTKRITTLEFDLSEKKKNGTLEMTDEKIMKLEVEELKYRSEERKNAIERLSKTIDKSITPAQSQTYVSKEQENLLKANSVQKSRSELITLRDDRARYLKATQDQSASITQAENVLASMNRTNKLDSINYDIKKNEIQETKFRMAANQAGYERTNRILNGTLSDEEKAKLVATEADNNVQANNYANNIKDLQKKKKEEEKVIRKENRNDKVDNTKLKVKIKLLKSEIAKQEKDLDKAKGKKKPNPDDIAKKEKALEENKAKLIEYESQLK